MADSPIITAGSVVPVDQVLQSISPGVMSAFLERIQKNAYLVTGKGSIDNSFQNALTRFDRYGAMQMPTNQEHTGITFITRPRLNFSSISLRMNSVLATLDTYRPDSVAFMIRALLDTKLATGGRDSIVASMEDIEFFKLVQQSPLVDARNPFNPVLTNCLTDISGWPDFTIETETTEGGYHSEDFTFARGSDMNYRSTELSLGFRDLQGGIVMSMFYYWSYYIALQCKFRVMAYLDDIYERRLNYDCAIYRFTFDPSREVIVSWAKATGCFPKTTPIGAKFNVSQGEVYSSSATKFTMPFVANKVEYMDPDILKDFNTLVSRYWPSIEDVIQKQNGKSKLQIAANEIAENFVGIPYIVSTNRGIELKYVYEEGDIDRPIDAITEFSTESREKKVQTFEDTKQKYVDPHDDDRRLVYDDTSVLKHISKDLSVQTQEDLKIYTV